MVGSAYGSQMTPPPAPETPWRLARPPRPPSPPSPGLCALAFWSMALAGCASEQSRPDKAPEPSPDSSAARPAPPASPPPDWAAAEAGVLSDHAMLTLPERFARAGEAYFDHATPPRWIIFQATPAAPADAKAPEASTHFAMYAARLRWAGTGNAARITGIEEPIELSPPGSANTCGWFDPRDGGRVLFGSTIAPPGDNAPSGYARDRSRYQWQFHSEMRVVTARLPAPGTAPAAPLALFDLPGGPGYAAECSWSPDGRHVLYTYRDPRTRNPDMWLWDSATNRHTALVTAPGYNGGGFFVPAGPGAAPRPAHGAVRPWAIVYRSDRRGDSQLQLYIATLRYDDPADPARITGLGAERALTDNRDVNWAPFAFPGEGWPHVVFASSRQGHANYEVYALGLPAAPTAAKIEAPQTDWPATRDALPLRRVTHAPGFDGLPAFSADGSWMIWTSQRRPPAPPAPGGALPGPARPSSQVWVARYTPPAPPPPPPAPTP